MFKNFINLSMLFIIIFFINSCKDNKVETSKSKTVNTIKTANTINFSRIKPGSILSWNASHLGGTGKRSGKIDYKKVLILVNDGKVTNISVTIDMDKLTVENLSIDDIKDLTEHLKSDDFFNIKSHPTSKFEMTKIEALHGEYNTKVTGNLEILGVSKSITFKANINVLNSEVSIKSEYFTIDRSDWGMTYNAEGTAGVPLDYLISNDVGFTINIILQF